MATEVLLHQQQQHHHHHAQQQSPSGHLQGPHPHQSELQQHHHSPVPQQHQHSPVPQHHRHNNDAAPPSPFHPHSSNEHNAEDGNGNSSGTNNGRPTAADFAADGNNDLDEPRMVTNGDGTVEDWNHITKPGGHDVLLGRGGGTNNHCGNVKFRQLVNEHKMAYLACSKVCFAIGGGGGCGCALCDCPTVARTEQTSAHENFILTPRWINPRWPAKSWPFGAK
jgi:hypothetical protein